VGKSTLLNVVLGFTAPDEGRVRVGSTDLADVSLERWRERIAWVPQRPHLFAGTIAENVRLARPAADDRAVTEALRDAGAYEFVRRLPDGERTVLGEDGAGLSAGQRQRIALARAFLADRPVLLLDEPTASLDGETEAGIVEAVRRLATGRTVLLVVHRPALLPVADRVVTLTASAGVAQQASAALPRTSGSASVPGDILPTEPAPTDEAPEETTSARRHVLTRVRDAAGAQRARFGLALLLGSLALGSAVGLMAVSGWLISRASEQPPVLYL
ncbi:ATP-binding cassette domain-containing protein, partial [Streptomyces sp. DT225]